MTIMEPHNANGGLRKPSFWHRYQLEGLIVLLIASAIYHVLAHQVFTTTSIDERISMMWGAVAGWLCAQMWRNHRTPS